jgi:hypothetical protein
MRMWWHGMVMVLAAIGRAWLAGLGRAATEWELLKWRLGA